MKKIIISLVISLIWSVEVGAQSPYYQGKSLRIVVGYPAGSAHDIWAWLIAPRLPDAPLFSELMDRYQTGEADRRLVNVMLGSGAFGTAPMISAPGVLGDQVKMLRTAYASALNDGDLVAEAKKKGLEPAHISGEELESLAKEVINQPAEVIAAMKKVMGG